MKSPFKFLDSYTLEDRAVFFGRDQEITELYRRVFESKMLLVYGISGTGKSSLINCGLASRFDESDWLPLNVRRGSNIVDSINDSISKYSITPFKKKQSITEKLQSVYLDHFKPVFLIFDQFEELFIFGSEDEKKEFIKLIKEIVNSKIQCRVVFVIREEFLAGITEFEEDIPDIFSNRFRVEKMKRANALLAVEGPCRVNNIETEEGFSGELINRLSLSGNEIELTYLQIFLDRIFRIAIEMKDDSGELHFSKELLTKAGSVSDLLGSFLDEQIREMNDPATAMAILKSFVSIQGTKKQMTSKEISEVIKTFGMEIPENELIRYLEKFVDLRILREKDESGHFELRHDALASKIFEKFTALEKDIIEVRQFIENAWHNYQKRGVLLSASDLVYISPYESRLYLSKEYSGLTEKSKNHLARAIRRRRNISISSTITLLIIFAGFTIWALNERGKALEERKIADLNFIKAKANNLAYASQKVLETDPTIALRIAEYAFSLDSVNPTVAENLNKIYSDNNFYKILAKLESRISTLAVSPDGQKILIGSFDNIIRLMDLNGNVLKLFSRHKDRINSIQFSPDGTKILSGARDSTACLWDLYGNQQKVFRGDDEVVAAAFSPDGKNILIGTWETMNIVDLNGKILRKIKIPHEVTSVAFYPDSKKFLTGLADSTICLWDLNGKLLRVFRGHQNYITSISLSPDCMNILTGSEDRTAILWDINGKILQVFRGHNDALYSAIFSPNGKYILTGSWDKTARLWDRYGNVLQIFKGHEESVMASAFLPDGNSILTVSYDNTVRMWDLEGIKPFTFKNHTDWVNSAVFNPQGNKILTGSDDETVCVWDIKGNLLKVFGDLKEPVYSVAFSPNGQNILAGSYFKSTCMWNLKGNKVFEFKVNKEGVTPVTFSPDGKSFLIGNPDSIKYCDLTGNVLRAFKNQGGELYSIAFSPDGSRFLTGTIDSLARLWDLKGNILQVFKGHDLIVHSVAFSPEGKYVLTGSCDNTARLWDLQGNLIQVFRGHNGHVHTVAFSPDSKYILTGSMDKTTRLWNTDGSLIQEFSGLGYIVNSVNFSPEGRHVLIGSEDGTARLWEIKKSLEEYKSKFTYQELSIAQRISYGILEYSDVIKIDNENTTDEAADYYFGVINQVGKNQKGEYISNAINLYGKLIDMYEKDGYISRRDSLILLLNNKDSFQN